VTDSKSAPNQQKAWYAYVRDQYVPTAGIAWTKVAGFLGWLQLPRSLGGLQMDAEQAQTLAWLVRDDLIEQYLDWKIRRSGDVVHSGIEEFPRFVSGLVNSKTGYLKLTTALSNSLVLQGMSWAEQCEQCFAGMKELKQHYEGLFKTSRDPFEPIQAVLVLPNPLDAVADMTFRMTADRPLTNGTQEAVWARDLALIRLLMSNPLRIKNLQELTWRADNSGQLYQQPDGSWHIRIDRKDFKNHQGAAKERDYHNPVDPMVWPILQQYLTIHRPRLVGGRNSDYVFVSQEPQEKDGPWTRMNRRVFTLTARYLWGCPGVGPHAFRHIVATAILKNSPNDWQTAALVLHDKVETVQKHYAHLRSADGARRMHSLFEKTFARA
jgi:integrase